LPHAGHFIDDSSPGTLDNARRGRCAWKCGRPCAT